MLSDPFVQTTSILNRLRSVMVAIAVFILISFFALYFSSQSLFNNLQALNRDNNILNYTSQALESLNTAELRISDLLTPANASELSYRFNENIKISELMLNRSLKLTKTKPKVEKEFLKVRESLDHFKASTALTFQLLKSENTKTRTDEIQANVLASRQYLMDAKEQLLKIQIMIKQENDSIFNSIYKNRFRPLLVAVFLSTLFFTFVLTFGLTISRKIGTSISNLLRATDYVAHGALDYQAKIMERDEIGRVTDAFNKMVHKLNRNRVDLNLAIGRTKKLQEITAAFSEALTPDQVFDVIFDRAFKTLPIEMGSIVLIAEDRNQLILKRVVGLNNEYINRWQSFPMNARIPITECIRFGRPLFLTSEKVLEYEDVDREYVSGSKRFHAYLPLMIGSECLGAISFIFDTSIELKEEDKDFIYALTRQCAQALHRSQLYEDAKKAIEARDEFLSIASHELRTPLTPLKLQLQGLQRHIQKGNLANLPPEKIIKMVQTSDRQINRLSTLIDDLLDVSRITSGRLSLNRERFSLREMLEEVLVQYSQQLTDAHSRVRVQIQTDLVGEWDKVRIEQVVINLLTNAAKYAPNKPIYLRLDEKDGQAMIEVRDEGPGIAPADQERIFKRFERVHSKNNVGGLGLGLYISKQIVEAHHGHISVESTEGSGATFRIFLPLGV